MGLKAAWAMDLTTFDESGNPWDFSKAEQRKKALRRLKEDKPLMLITCPMCGPFSSMNELNYARMSELQIKETVQRGALVPIRAPCGCKLMGH